jgi:hypothetical protein
MPELADLASLVSLQAVVCRGRMQRLTEDDLCILCGIADDLGLTLWELVERYKEFEV